jgi:hypothetical protein
MSGEIMSNIQEKVYLSIGEGAINPQERVAKGEITEAEIDGFAERMETDEFYDEVAVLAVPNRCVDGRGRKDGVVRLGADAAGGTFSVVMADALTTNRYRQPGEKAPKHAQRLYEELQKNGYEIKVHDDDHATDPNCGCGAEDKLDSPEAADPSIVRYIVRRGDDIRGLLGALDIVVDDETHTLITGNAADLADTQYATNGAELREAAKNTAGEGASETYTGPHRELALGINTREGTTLNRQKITDTLGDKFQAFNLDVPVLKKAAELTSLSPREAEQKFIAMLYYNVATAATLADKSLRITVHS